MTSPLSRDALPPGRAIAALLLNAFIWGVSWWPFRWLNEHGLHSLWATAAIYLLAWLLVVARAPRATLAAMSNPALLALAGASGVTNACFNWGVATGDVVRVVEYVGAAHLLGLEVGVQVEAVELPVVGPCVGGRPHGVGEHLHPGQLGVRVGPI